MATSLNVVSQTSVNYVMQVANINSHHTINTNSKFVAGHYNINQTELGTYANDNGAAGSYTGDPGTASFRLFSVDGSTTGGASRSLQIGDEFKITGYVGNSTSFFNNSSVGISLNNGTAGAQFSNFNQGQRLKMQINNNGNWFIAGSTFAVGFSPTGQDVTLTILITSANTANVTISSNNGATTSELALSGTGPIQSFCIWNQSSGKNQSSSNDVFWKNCSVTAKGGVTIGEFVQNVSLTEIAGVISDGLAANSTSTISSNSLTKKGTGTITLTGVNSYTGATTVEFGTLIVSGAGALGQGSDVVVDAGATLRIENSITINSLTNNGTVVVTSSGKLNVTGAIVNNGTFTVLANNSGYGQLKAGSTISGTITQEQYLNGIGHHSISSSMTNGFFTTSGANKSALYSYDAATGAYNMSPTNTSAGEGFFAPVGTNGFLQASGVFSVSGTPVTSHTHNLGFAANQQAGGSGSGWNLIGNPYTCSLDWSSVTKPGALNDAIYIWDPNDSKYNYWVNGINPPNSFYAGSQLASGLIAPMQAFWVQTTGTTAFATTMVDNGSTTSTIFYKNNPDNLILIAQEVGDSTMADAMWLKNVAGTTLGFEGSEDAWKMTNYGGQPMIYSVDLDEKLAINSIDLNGPSVTPVGFSSPNAGGKYRITLEQVVSNLPYEVVLEDKLFGTFNDLTQGDYSFSHTGWQNEGPRFALHTVGSALASPEKDSPTLLVYQDGSRLVVKAPEAANYRLLAIDGRVLLEGTLIQGSNVLPLISISSGIYVLCTDDVYASSAKISITNN